MTKSNRITYRFDRRGNKIDEVLPAREADSSIEPSVVKQPETLIEHQAEDAREDVSLTEPSHLVEYELDYDKLERLIRESNGSEAASVLSDEVSPQNAVEDTFDLKASATLSDTFHKADHAEDMSQNMLEHQSHLMKDTDSSTYAGNGNDSHEQQWYVEPSMVPTTTKAAAQSTSYDEREQQRLYELDQYEDELLERNFSSRTKNFEPDMIEETPRRSDRRQTFTWVNGAVSVASAIVTGVCIGYLLLSLVFGMSVWPFSSLNKSAASGQNAVHEIKPNTNEQAEEQLVTLPVQSSESSQPAVAGLQLDGAHYSYQVLQAGVFTLEKTRDEVLATLSHAGYEGHFIKDDSDRYFVYAGVATSPTNAAPVQSGIKGVETYRKELTVTLPSQMPFLGEADQLEQYVNEANTLIAMYADLVTAQLEQTSFSAIGEAAQRSWQASHEQWLKLADAIEPKWASSEDKQHAQALKEQLIEADKQLQGYQEQPRSNYLWKVQSALVKSVLIQKEWFE